MPDFPRVWELLVALLHEPAFWFWVVIYLAFCLIRGITMRFRGER